MPSRTPLGAYYIYQRRGYHSVCLQLRLWKASNCKTGRSQIPRFSFVANGTSIKQSDSGCLADILQERMNQNELKYKVFDWLRFPLIVFVVYIHSFGKPIDFYAIDFSNPMPMDYYNLFRISISHVLTHIAVPMFFFISGFLFFNKLQEWNRTVYFDKLKKRIKTLLIPFFIWNTIKIMLKVQSMIRHDGFDSLWTYMDDNNVIALYWNSHTWNLDRTDWFGLLTPSSSPYLVPLWYLRDLMVTMVLSPILYYLFKYARIWGLALLFFSYISLVGIKVPGFSTTALFFFGTGAYFNLNKIDPTQCTWKYKNFFYGLAIILWLIVARFDGHNTPLGNLLYPFYIIMGSIAMFNLATSFVKSGRLLPRLLTQSTFFVYLAHTIMITGVSSSVMRKIFGEENVLSLSISYLLAPILTVTICVVSYWILKKYLPKLCGIMTGER